MLKNKASSLVEIMVALSILSIILLGISMAQIQSLQISQLAQQKNKAHLVVQDLVGRISANAKEAMKGKDSAYNSLKIGLPNITGIVCEGANANACNSQQLARYDLQQANALALSILGSSTTPVVNICQTDATTTEANLCHSAGLSNNLEIRIRWKKIKTFIDTNTQLTGDYEIINRPIEW